MTELDIGCRTSDRQAPMTKGEIRDLVHRAGDAAERLEAMVRKLVEVRAWEVLGYASFEEMWEQENGFDMPALVRTIAIYAMADEGLNTLTGANIKHHGPNGHTGVAISKAIVGRTLSNGSGAIKTNENVKTTLNNYKNGVPSDLAARSISGRTRNSPRRLGAGPDDNVSTSFFLSRRNADAVERLAEAEGISNAEIYRRAVQQYLDREGVSTYFGNAVEGGA